MKQMFIFTASRLHGFTASRLRHAVFLSFFCFGLAKINAQAVNNQIKDVVMPSPNAASLGKYGNIPVSYNTGVPNVGIPIHTVQDGPLTRPIKQTNVDATFMQSSYGSNNSTDARIFTQITEGVVSSPSFYAANMLLKTTMIDENNHSTIVFKDKLGRVVLTRKLLSGAFIGIYNVYDDFGQLVAVLPPGSVDASGNVTYSLIFQYTYDNKNRLVQKKVPGADAQKFYYDNRDLLVLTQDGNMRAENTTKHLGTIYDNLGRVIKTGFALVSPTQGVDFTLTNAQITDSLTSTIYYANKSWVAHQNAKVLKPTTVTTNRNL